MTTSRWPLTVVRRCGAALLLVAAGAALAVPAQPLDYEAYPYTEVVFQHEGANTGVAAGAIFGRDIIAFTNENSGLHVAEITAGGPVELGAVQLPGVEIDVALKDWTAFVLKGFGSVQSVLLALPESPTPGTAYALPGEPSRLLVAGDRLYIACGSAGLQVFAISGSGTLSFVGAWGSDVTAVAADGFRLAVVNQGRVDLLDFEDPANPVWLGDSDAAGISGCRDVVLSGDTAWISSGTTVLRMDISDPGAMVELSSLYGRGHVYRDGSDLIVAQTGGGVVNSIVFADFWTGAYKRHLGWFHESTSAAVLAGHIIGAADDYVTVMRDGDRSFPEPQDTWDWDYHYRPVGFCASDVLVEFMLYPDSGLAAREIGGGPLWEHPLPLVGDERLQGYASRGSLAAVLCSETVYEGAPARLRLATVSRYGVTERGVLAFPDLAWYRETQLAFLDDQTLIVLGLYDPDNPGNHSVRAIDVGDPDNPVEIGRVALGLSVADQFDVSEDLVMAAGAGEYELVSAADPTNLVAFGPGSFGRKMALYGDRLFAGSSVGFTNHHVIDTWDVSNPADPVQVASLPVPWTAHMVTGDGWAIMPSTGTLFDLTDPAGITPVGNAAPEQSWSDESVVCNGEYLVYLDRYSQSPQLYRALAAPYAQGAVSGVDEIPGMSSGLALAAAPNPFNPRTSIHCSLPTAGLVDVAVHDLAGRRVATLWRGHRQAGAFSATWDGRDRASRPVAAGTYFVRVVQNGARESLKVMLIK